MNQLITTKKYLYVGSPVCVYLWYFEPHNINWTIGEGMEFDSMVTDTEDNPKKVTKVQFDTIHFGGTADSLQAAMKKIHLQMVEGNDKYQETDLKEMWTEQYMKAVI